MQPIQYQTDLTPYNTFGLKTQAQAFVALKHSDELRDIVRLPEFDRDTVFMARRRQQYPFDGGLRRSGCAYGKQGNTRN